MPVDHDMTARDADLRMEVRDGFALVSWKPRDSRRRVETILDAEALRLDTDGDGMTDLLERTLGLDPAHPDSDRDGAPDGYDAWPLVAPRPDAPDRALLQAAWSVAVGSCVGRALLVIQDARAGELSGYPGPVLVASEATRALGPLQARPVRLSVLERAGDRGRVLYVEPHTDIGGPWPIRVRRVRGRWLAW
jgi:hypothetical protein